MKLKKELLEKIKLAFTFVGKKVYASEHNFENNTLSSLVDGVEIRQEAGNKLGIYLTTFEDDLHYTLDLEDFNKTWFLTKNKLKEYWENEKSI